MKNKVYAYLFPTITFVLWGSLYVISKTAMEEIPPLTLLFLRYAVAVALFLPVLRIRFGCIPRIPKGSRGLMAAIGLIGYGLGIALQQVSNDMLDASLAALINSINPVFIFILASLILKERMTAGKVFGTLLAIAGVYVIFGSSGGGISIPGLALAMFSVFFWSLSSVLVRKVTSEIDPLVMTMYGMLIGLAGMAPAAAAEMQFVPCTISLKGILSVFYLGIVTTAFAHFLWNKALSAAPAGTCSMFYPVQPLTSAVMGVLVLGEPVTAGFIIGAAVISAGVLLAVASDSRRGADRQQSGDSERGADRQRSGNPERGADKRQTGDPDRGLTLC